MKKIIEMKTDEPIEFILQEQNLNIKTQEERLKIMSF